ncbi:MAG: hypothetical protein GWN09_08400 [Gammaproteobacteria bacterium]|nr:hypothetical protein [Gammaproteobacteria bacterium]
MLLGTAGDFSAVVLRALLESRAWVCAVALPGAPANEAATGLPAIPVAGADALSALAAAAGIPRERVAGFADGHARERLARHRPDLIVTACFPYILPPWALALPAQGCLNVHPSLLPAYRGPAPLFWQMRSGERRTGVTLHWMTRAVDAGDILGQRSLPIGAGDAAQAINVRLARLGGELVREVLQTLDRGETPRAYPQDEAAASYFPWPDAADFELTTAWPAERAFRFIRGTQGWGRPYRIRGEAFALTVRSAGTFEMEADLETTVREVGDALFIRFRPGVLRVAVSDVLETEGRERS